MDQHIGNCRKLIQGLQELMPNKFNFANHNPGPDDECFRSAIAFLVKQASEESLLTTEYAIACNEIAELFEPLPGEGPVNQFKYLLANQCDLMLKNIRANPAAYKSEAEYLKFDLMIKAEKGLNKKRMNYEQKCRYETFLLATGAIKFIAELFNVGFLKEKVMELCMKNLLKSGEGAPNELDIECFQILLTRIGEKFESHQKGVEVVDEYLNILERVIDEHMEMLCLRVRHLILDVFELRAKCWKPLKTQKPKIKTEEIVQDSSEMIEKAKADRNFLTELNYVLEHLQSCQLLEFMHRFADLQCNEFRLEGAVKIIFEKAILSEEKLLLAFVVKGLAQVKAQPRDGGGDRQTLSFKDYLMILIQKEIDFHRQAVKFFRQFDKIVVEMKKTKEEAKAEKIKAAMENFLVFRARVFKTTEFFSELYNVDFLESRFIFDFFAVMMTAEVISNVSIECLSNMMKNVGVKLVTENNRNVLLKDTLNRLFEVTKTIEISQRVNFLLKDLASFGRFQLKLTLDDQESIDVFKFKSALKPWSSCLSGEKLWESKMVEKKVPKFQVPLQMPPLELINPGVPPPTFNPYDKNNIFSSHDSSTEEKFKNMNGNRFFDMNNNSNFRQTFTPIDFSKATVDPTMSANTFYSK